MKISITHHDFGGDYRKALSNLRRAERAYADAREGRDIGNGFSDSPLFERISPLFERIAERQRARRQYQDACDKARKRKGT